MLAAVATAIMAYRVPGLKRGVARAAALAAAGTVAQVPLGALTVAFDLHPLLVMSHFLLAMAVVAASTWVTVRAWRLAHGGEPRPLDVPRVRRRRVGGRRRLPRAGHHRRVRHRRRAARRQHGQADRAAGRLPRRRLGARARRRDLLDAVRDRRRLAVAQARGSRAAAAVASRASCSRCASSAVGEYQYRNGLPWGVIAVHVAIAATLVVTVVTIAALVRDSAD